ncbi:hypothetical protein Ahy_A07g035335 [Arachis hypogaea]|uniref:Uncharacterized protein n=1 Tax=Arachis hypogaea TaxID=3818 RepID=A0A445CDN5_ARAHY|nr:hypothetical protein Ahy_A07g035335 [Arachis hypogaea]
MATVYREMSQEKKDIVEEMGFGAQANVPEMNGRIYITPRKVAAALGITNGGNLFPKKVDYNKLNPPDKEIFDSVKNISLATLTRNVLDMNVEGEENRKKFKRTFVVFIQKCFLLPTTVSVASPIHKPPIFHDWAKHVLNFLMKGVENKRNGKKQSVDGCVFVLMLIYFHETKFSRPFELDAPAVPRVAHWTREMIIDRISSEATQPLEELMKDDFIYVPPQEETQQTFNNDYPQETEKQGVTVSLTSLVIEDIFKDDYPCKRTTVTSPRTIGATAIRARITY